MRLVKGLQQDYADRIVTAVRQHGSFDSIDALRRAADVPVSALRRLAGADAFTSMGLNRQSALWQIRALHDDSLPMFQHQPAPLRSRVELPPVAMPRRVIHDYESVGLSLKAHPMSFIRSDLDHRSVTRNMELQDEARWPQGLRIAVAGLVLVRQRPATASGVIFITLEDETGIANLIVRPKVYERFRHAARHGIAVMAAGTVERQGAVVHVLVRSLRALDDALANLLVTSRDFH
jgi:error-prone DNA polymerase